MKIRLLTLLALNATAAIANTAIETETAQIGAKGDITFSQSIERARGRDGSSGGTLTQFEYGISDRAEILIEPFFYVFESPDDEQHVHGVGDLEITPSYKIVLEDGLIPDVLIATKIKVPTASTKVGGTRKYDVFPYLIFGQHYEKWTFNSNLGVNFAKPAEGGGYEKKVIWDLEAERQFAPNWTAFIEVFSAEEGVKTISGAAQYQLGKHFNAFLAVGYNEDHEVIIRPGFNLEF